MEFALSKPQELLRESARAFFTRTCPPARVRELMSGETAFDADLWRHIAEQGWIGLHLPEACGGLGLSLVELTVVAEEMGRACLPGPWLAALWAATLLEHADGQVSWNSYLELLLRGEQKGTVALLEPDSGWRLESVQLRVEDANDGFRLTGVKTLVHDAALADVILCAGRHDSGLMILPVRPAAPGVAITALHSLDETRKLYDVALNDVIVPKTEVIAAGERANPSLAHSLCVATVAICAELVGVMQRVMEMTVEYAKTRQQFGRAIGAFQAVQHQCADMLLLTESARSATYFAAWALAENLPDAPRSLSMAKAYCSDAARDVCQRGVQVHGGIGFTWEHDLHLYLKRAKANEVLFGDATHHREQIARLVLDEATSPRRQ